jgi:hypothetical protein
MLSGLTRRVYAFRVALRNLFSGAMLCLLALAWFAGWAPAVHAAGPGYCVITPTDEHAPTRPAIHLNHSEGPVGMRINVSASGWHPGARVSLHFDGHDPQSGRLTVLIAQAAPQAIVASDGSVTITSAEVPAYVCNDPSNAPNSGYHLDTAGGSTGYFVLASDDGEVSAPVAFRLLPAPTVAINGNGPNSYQMKVGTTITVAGSGWEPNEALTITLRSGDASHPPTVPYASEVHATTDAQGSFTASYLLDPRLPWNRNLLVMVEGVGPRYGTYGVASFIYLLPVTQPTFRVDHTLVIPGMAITVSGEHWYPGDTFTIKFCNAHWQDGSWVNGPNCGKESNPALGTVTVAADGRIHQQFIIPDNGPPRTILVRINEVTPFMAIQPIPVRIADHLPTWDDIHPRVAALRNNVVGSLPFTIPAVLALGALVFFAIRRRRMRRPPLA